MCDWTGCNVLLEDFTCSVLQGLCLKTYCSDYCETCVSCSTTSSKQNNTKRGTADCQKSCNKQAEQWKTIIDLQHIYESDCLSQALPLGPNTVNRLWLFSLPVVRLLQSVVLGCTKGWMAVCNNHVCSVYFGTHLVDVQACKDWHYNIATRYSCTAR